MNDAKIEQARQDARRDEKFEEQELAARHRPDERPPNDEAGPPGSGAGDIHAAGSTGGGSPVGGLGGTNIGDGSNENADIDAAAGSGAFDVSLDSDDEEAYAGSAGGAVGGTPAGKRAHGGRIQHGLAPGGVHRGDSTIGSDPARQSK